MKENELKIVYGLYDLCPEREQARWSFGCIMDDFADIKKRYVTLGFHLAEFKRCEYYKDFGYVTFEEFCAANVPLDKGSISRCMNVYEEFGKREKLALSPDTPKMWLDEKYKDYSYSQLVEMLPLDDKRRKMVTPDMPVSRIRQLKKECLVSDDVIRLFIEEYAMKRDSFTKSEVMAELMDRGRSSAGYCGEKMNYQFRSGKVAFDFSGDYYSFTQILDKYASLPDNKLVESVATSQPASDPEPEDNGVFPLYWSEELDSEEFISVIFEKIKIMLESFDLGINEIARNGKQLSFKDLDGNDYSLLYRVMKKKEDSQDVG